MQDLLRAQMDRQDRLHFAKLPSSGRVVSKEAGSAAAKRLRDGSSSADPTTNATAVVLEGDVAKKIVVLRQKQNKAANIKMSLKKARAERLPGVQELAKEARKAASSVLRKDSGTAEHNREKRKKKASRNSSKLTQRRSQ